MPGVPRSWGPVGSPPQAAGKEGLSEGAVHTQPWGGPSFRESGFGVSLPQTVSRSDPKVESDFFVFSPEQLYRRER